MRYNLKAVGSALALVLSMTSACTEPVVSLTAPPERQYTATAQRQSVAAAAPTMYRIDRRTCACSEASNYYVTFVARAGSLALNPGHAFVVFGKEDSQQALSSAVGYGFYPVSSSFRNYLFTVPGTVRREVIAGTLTTGTRMLIVRVNRAQYERALGIVAGYRSASSYNGYQRNCVSMAAGIAASIGLRSPSGTYTLPTAYLDALINRNR